MCMNQKSRPKVKNSKENLKLQKQLDMVVIPNSCFSVMYLDRAHYQIENATSIDVRLDNSMDEEFL